MANEKKTSRKKFRVAVSGSTVDGREISPVHLREAAENFNPDVYAARVNVEHYLSPCPSTPPPFPDTPTWGNLGIWGDRLLDALETCNADKRAIELLEQRRLQRLNNEDNNHAEN
ncbi:TPA: GPO family capsid scaffolding protein [Escherichia coli]|nr:GPO family capsid scaffolding protein [Escherichia coli]